MRASSGTIVVPDEAEIGCVAPCVTQAVWCCLRRNERMTKMTPKMIA